VSLTVPQADRIAGQRSRPGLSFLTVLGSVMSILTLVFLVTPILVIIPISFSSAQYLRFPPPGLSLQWYRMLFAQREWVESFWFTLRVAGMATLIATVLGVLASLALVRGRFPGKALVYAALISPMIVPSIITAIAVYFFFARLRLTGNPVAMALGMVIAVLPVVVIIVSATLQNFDLRLEQAAISLGAHPVRAFTRVTLPLISPGVVSAALFAFLGASHELLIPMFLSGTRSTTLTVRIWNSVILQIEPIIAAVSTLFIALVLAVLIANGLLRRRRA
jgi:putative spermidine/putrescine transport system permease protein